MATAETEAAPRIPRVLIIDDNAFEAGMVETAIRARGAFEVTLVNDVAEAVSIISSDNKVRFDLVLIDWRMPGASGDEVIETYWNHRGRSSAPVVVLSSAVPPSIRTQLEDKGAIVLEKPMDLDGYDALARQLVAMTARGQA